MMSQEAESVNTDPLEVCNRNEATAMLPPLETQTLCPSTDIACTSALRHNRESTSSGSSNSGDTSNGRDHCCDLEDGVFVATPEYNTPIIGYEVMEERARFTVFKIRVEHVESGRYWFVFRRYTDFTRLSRKLKSLFPGLQLSLPPKRWFGNNFDPLFLEDRLLGLQTFIKNIMSHRDISRSTQVREFFCLDEPPEPLDTIEESRALCESLEEKVYRLTQQLQEKDAEIESLQSELSSLRIQQSAIAKGLKVDCNNDEHFPESQALSPVKHDSER